MNKFLVLFYLLISSTELSAQQFNLYYLNQIKRTEDTIGFISLSDTYQLSSSPDSLAVPDLRNVEYDSTKNYEYICLDSNYRKQFLRSMNFTENDKVYIYSYSKKLLISLPIHTLKTVACLNFYGAEWPYKQWDYMIGFEINLNKLKGYEKYFTNTLVFVGKHNPFVVNQLKSIVWEQIDTIKFPLGKEKMLEGYSTGCIKSNAYYYTNGKMMYYIQDWKHKKYGIWVKHLIILDSKTKQIIFERYYYTGESTSFNSIYSQWTGRLFKNKPSVIFGFTNHAFSCPYIDFIDSNLDSVYINCDNRH